MFKAYPTSRLVDLRSLCADVVEVTGDTEKRAETLLILQRINEELAARQEKQAA